MVAGQLIPPVFLARGNPYSLSRAGLPNPGVGRRRKTIVSSLRTKDEERRPLPAASDAHRILGPLDPAEPRTLYGRLGDFPGEDLRLRLGTIQIEFPLG